MDRNRRIAPRASLNDVVASRLAALETLTAVAKAGWSGPALLTGEPGAGKTWLRRRLAEVLPAGWGAVVVEIAPALDAIDFLTLAAAKLGVAPLPERPAILRLAIEKALEDDGLDGRRRLLIVEDAHHASPAVWAEAESFCDRLGEPEGFAAALIVGRTELTRRMASPPLRSLASRLSRHLHLPPLDMDEAAQLLPGLDPGELEILHRDAAGTPRRLLALAADRLVKSRPIVAAPAPVAEAPPSPSFPSRIARPAPAPPPIVVPHPGRPKVAVPAEPAHSPPALLPSRPPLRVEDGLIEVGWAGDLEAEEADEFDELDAIDSYADDADDVDDEGDGELIDDHYAALQAWTEWARNRDRLSRPADAPAEIAASAEPEPDAEEAADESPTDPSDIDAGIDAENDSEARDELDEDEPETAGDLRAEPPHDHAPYGQLFGKMRLSS